MSPYFQDGLHSLKDLKEGMILEGVVTNVADFGAFVDIGVHQDGLVHISALANQFVKNPRDVVKTGEIVKVKVLQVDMPRKRISLTMRLQDDVQASHKPQQQKRQPGHAKRSKDTHHKPVKTHKSGAKKANAPQSMFGEALKKAISAKEDACT